MKIPVDREKIEEVFLALTQVIAYGNQRDVENICKATGIILEILMDNPIKSDISNCITNEDSERVSSEIDKHIKSKDELSNRQAIIEILAMLVTNEERACREFGYDAAQYPGNLWCRISSLLTKLQVTND